MSIENLKVTQVDPRYVTQEQHEPVYRVDFWDQNRGSEENRIANAQSIDEVLAWAEAHRNGRYVVVWVEYSHDAGTGLIRLRGWEPTDPDSPSFHDPYFQR